MTNKNKKEDILVLWLKCLNKKLLEMIKKKQDTKLIEDIFLYKLPWL
jgi:hypothetical protein